MIPIMFYHNRRGGMKNLFAIFLIILFSFAANAYELKNGDLIFQIEDNGDFSQAISKSTSFDDSLSFVHVGIIEVKNNDDIVVIEASPKNGVCITPLEAFLKESPFIDGKPGVVVKRLNINFPVKETIKKAKSHLGEDYDWWYLPDNGKMYCSELIYESYRDVNNKPLFEAKPMNFRNSDGSMPEFWINLFKKLNQPVPEGVPGTNPQDLAKDKNLIEIHRFF